MSYKPEQGDLVVLTGWRVWWALLMGGSISQRANHLDGPVEIVLSRSQLLIRKAR